MTEIIEVTTATGETRRVGIITTRFPDPKSGGEVLLLAAAFPTRALAVGAMQDLTDDLSATGYGGSIYAGTVGGQPYVSVFGPAPDLALERRLGQTLERRGGRPTSVPIAMFFDAQAALVDRTGEMVRTTSELQAALTGWCQGGGAVQGW